MTVVIREVVADGMETILKDGKVVEFMADVKQKDHAAWEIIKGWFKNLAKFLQKMVDAYKGQSAQTIEGARVAEFSEDLLNQIKQIWGEGAVASGENYQTAEVKENTTEAKNTSKAVDSAETTRFAQRDTRSVPADISNFVDTALTDRRSSQQIQVTVATSLDNKAIHRLGAQYNDHYDGASRTITSRYIRHIINNHGDPIIEALRGQLHMDGDAIKIALSKLQSGAGRVIGKGESIRGNPTVITEIPINGYTLYVGEPVGQLSGIDLEGRTMFMTPTSTKVLMPTKSASVPQRRSGGHTVIIDGKKRIVNGFLADASGNIAEVNYIETNGSPYTSVNTQFLYTMCNDTDVLSKYAPNNATIGKANVAISNPYLVTPQNPVFTPEDLEKGRIGARVKEIKNMGYDAIIMDYKSGDNYMVMAFDKKSVVKLSDRDSNGPALVKAAVEHFGRTYRWKETGYLLADGAKLDFSGRHEGASGGYRAVDHRAILDIYPEDTDLDGNGAMVDFMRQGNIRIMPEGDGINLQVQPTKAQEQALDDFISRARGEVTLDIDDANGNTVVSVEYPRGTRSSKVLQDIRNYFENGTEPVVSDVSRFRYSDRDYSYEGLTSKPDMAVTLLAGNVPTNRADVIAEAKKNAAKIGKFDPKTGSVSVHVKDIARDVVLGTAGLKHGLDRRVDVNSSVVLKAGEILQSSILINELTPQKTEAEESYVLIGAAMDSGGGLFVIRSVVNRFSNELTSMDVLYAVNAKKGNRLRSVRPGFQGPVTDSTISIAELLDHVNKYFPDILPEDVLKHFGHDRRPDGKLGESALYQDRTDDSVSNRTLLANALESVAQNDMERNRIAEYKKKIAQLDAQEKKLRELNAQIIEI